MVFFRVDSNPTISGGHVMRCLAIAETLLNAGVKVRFLVADENPVSVLREAGIDYTVLQSDWKDLMSDVGRLKDILSVEENPVLVIDTYSVTKEYVDELKSFTRIVYLGSKPKYLGNIDLLINYSTDIDYDFYHKYYSKQTNLLLGPSYAPLREEFRIAEKEMRSRIKRVLLTTGNTDIDHMADAVLKALLPIIGSTEIVVDVVIGRMFDDKETLHSRYDNSPLICLHESVQNMSALMNKCDLAISANGTTVYELSAMGVPTISFAMVPEQIKSAEALSSLGVVDYCGRSYENRKICVEAIKNRFIYYMDHNDELSDLGRKAHSLIDGRGCQKIVEEILRLL